VDVGRQADTKSVAQLSQWEKGEREVRHWALLAESAQFVFQVPE
jgi:hypothetical protein